VIGDSKQSFFIAKVLSAVKYHTHPANEREVVQNGAVPAFPKIASSVKIEPPPSEIPAIQKEIELAEQLQQAGKTADAVKTYRQALDSDPNNAEALNNLAWILTTANDPSIRNGAEAVRLGIKAVRLTQGRQPVIIGTLAAAYAESGDFSNSVATAELARELAQLTGRKDIAEKNAQAANLYASGKTIATQNRP
jgi:tetratricopeptide (TPR) repeat protein